MESLARDLRYACGLYSKNKSFTIVALLILAIGCGATTALFILVNAILLRPLPFPDSQRIVEIKRRLPVRPEVAVSYPWFRYAARNSRTFEYFAAWGGSPGVNIYFGSAAQAVHSLNVSADFFRVLHVQPLMGRDFRSQDDVPGAPLVAVVSHGLWKGLLNGDEKVVGQHVRMSGEDCTIIGVMPPGFTSGPEVDVWLPFRKAEDANDTARAYFLTGRLRPGVRPAMGEEELNLLWKRFVAEHPGSTVPQEIGITLTRFVDLQVGSYRSPMMLLLAAAGCILMISCANVANLLLVRAAGRRKEIAVRIALGTSRLRLLRQLFTESLLLSSVGATGGLALAMVLLRMLRTWLVREVNRGVEVSIDFRVLGFVLALSVLTGLVFGLAPALHLIGMNAAQTLRDSGRASSNRLASWIRGGLVTLEISLSTAILVAAGLLLASYQKMQGGLGFEPGGVLTVQTSFAGPAFQTTRVVASTVQRITERLRTIPGIESVAAVSKLPTAAPRIAFRFALPQSPAGADSDAWIADWKMATPEYFAVLRVPMMAGRAFTEHDTQDNHLVAIVNETFVRRFLHGAINSAVGQTVAIVSKFGPDLDDQPREIAGVASDIRGDIGLDEDPRPAIFLPLAQVPDRTLALMNRRSPLSWAIRTHGEPLSYGQKIHDEVLRADPAVISANPRTLEQVLDSSLATRKMQSALITAFAGIALLLASIGLYGVVSHSVLERKHEVGIRLALGARGRDVLRLIFLYGTRLLVVGIGIGLLTSRLLRSVLAAFVFGIQLADIRVYLSVLAVLCSVGLIAVILPALRAAKIDPIIVLEP